MTFGERIRELREVKGDSHQIWRTQRVQGNVASLRLFLRFSTGPSHAFEPQSLGRVRDPVRIAEGPTHDFGFSILDFGLLDCGLKQHESHCRKRLRGESGTEGAAPSLVPGKRGWPPTPLTNLGGLCLELLSGKGLESAFLEEIGLKHETVFCHHGAVLPQAPMDTRTVPWLHRLRLPPRGHLPNRHNGEPSVLSRSLARCVSFSPLKSGNKSNTPPASTVAGTGFAGHCNPSS